MCFIFGHIFRKIGRQLTGKCIERYVECRRCEKVIMSIQPNQKYFSVYETASQPLYFERKPIFRIDKNHHRNMVKRMNDAIENGTYKP